MVTLSIVDHSRTRRRRPLMIVIDRRSKIKVVRKRTVKTSATAASTTAKIMIAIPATATAWGSCKTLVSTIMAAAITAATALMAKERTGGGGARTKRVF